MVVRSSPRNVLDAEGFEVVKSRWQGGTVHVLATVRRCLGWSPDHVGTGRVGCAGGPLFIAP